MATNERYTTRARVQKLLRLGTAFGAATNPTQEQVDDLIDMRMSDIDNRIHDSFHLSQQREYRDIKGVYYSYTGVKVYLSRRNIVTPLATASGDSLKVFDGSSWSEYVDVKTEARGSDFWLDELSGILHIRYDTLPKYLGIDITYRYNSGARTQVNDASNVAADDTSITVDSTTGFPYQGWIRIDDEEMTYTGKTSTTITGLTRGAYDTTAATHNDDAVIFWCPPDIRECCTKMVALDIIVANDFSSGGTSVGDVPADQIPLHEKYRLWREDIDRILAKYSAPILAYR